MHEKRIGAVLSLSLSLVLAFGCGGSSPGTPVSGSGTDGGVQGSMVASCQTTLFCQEYQGDAAGVTPYTVACSQAKGTWQDSACTHLNSLGGCRVNTAGLPVVLTNWFYTGGPYGSAAAVMSVCTMSNSTYITP